MLRAGEVEVGVMPCCLVGTCEPVTGERGYDSGSISCRSGHGGWGARALDAHRRALPRRARAGRRRDTERESPMFIKRALVVAGIVGLGALAPAVAMAAPSGTGHTVTSTQVTHGSFDPELDGPNPC